MRSRRECRSAVCLLVVAGFLLPGGAALAKPPKAGAQIEFGVQMARRGLWSEALFRFQQAAELEPGNFRNLNNLAVAYEAVGKFEEALEHYKKALAASPNNKELRRNYTRFIEFYQGFRPAGEEEGAAAAAPADGSAEDGDENDGG